MSSKSYFELGRVNRTFDDGSGIIVEFETAATRETYEIDRRLWKQLARWVGYTPNGANREVGIEVQDGVIIGFQ